VCCVIKSYLKFFCSGVVKIRILDFTELNQRSIAFEGLPDHQSDSS
jgi:hypothetical protein